MTHEASFGIRTARDFLREVVIPQYDDFIKENSSSRHALIAIILSYHMYEWVHRRKFCRQHFEATYPNDRGLAEKFDLARKITNGTKHFGSTVKTQTQSGFSSAFSDAFARPLNVILHDGNRLSVDSLLREIVDFWKRQDECGLL